MSFLIHLFGTLLLFILGVLMIKGDIVGLIAGVSSLNEKDRSRVEAELRRNGSGRVLGIALIIFAGIILLDGLFQFDKMMVVFLVLIILAGVFIYANRQALALVIRARKHRR